MNKLPVTYINTHMGRSWLICFKENKISYRGGFHWLGKIPYLTYCSWDRNILRLKYILNETTAIKSAGRFTPPNIRGPNHSPCFTYSTLRMGSFYFHFFNFFILILLM